MSSTPTPTGPGPEQYLFITPVWGEVYVDRFVKVSLPSQLSAGNLGAIPPGKGLYLIYTRREHAKAITRSAAYRRLKAMMAVSVRSLDDLPDPRINENPHELQTAAYTRGIKAGEGKQTAYVFLTPDILIGDGTLASAVRLTEAGKRVHLVAGVRMSTDGAVACVAADRAAGRPEIPIPPRRLVRHLLDNLHPISAAHVVTNDTVRAPQHLYWTVGDQGLLVRAFHLHPLVVWPRVTDVRIRNTIDDEFIARACPDPADWHTVTDSDEMCVVEFSDRRHKRAMITDPLTDSDMLRFMVESTTPDHRDHVLKHIRFHTHGVAAGDWAATEVASDKLIKRYLDLYAKFAKGLPDTPAEAPALGTTLHSRLDGMLGRSGSTSFGEISLPKLLLLGLAAPFWVLYRIVNYKVYSYLDRLYAEHLNLQQVMAYVRLQLSSTTRQLEYLSKRVAELEAKAGGDRPEKTPDEPPSRKPGTVRRAG